jgi:predicted ATPase
MQLRAAHFRHYKSLDDVRVEFAHPITVIVGPNAVGKSNLVDALRFLRDAVTADLYHAVAKRGGIARIRQHSRSKPYKVHLALEVGHDLVNLEHGEVAKYEIALKSGAGGNYLIEHERAHCIDEAYKPVGQEPDLSFQWQRVDVGFVRDDDGKIQGAQQVGNQRLQVDQLALGSGPFVTLGGPIAKFLQQWRFSSIYPNTLKTPAVPDQDAVLSEEGTNWASVLKAMRRTQRGRAAFERITEAMSTVIPSFRDVTVSTVGSYLVPRFRFEIDGQVTEFDPIQLSDGTLRIFGILLALYQPLTPGLLVIEEPEQTVHPGVLGVVADAIREASETTQIIVTTHSPHLVDHFQPEEVRVASMVNGLTTIAPIKAAQVEAVKRRLMSLEDFMLSEGLLPEEA